MSKDLNGAFFTFMICELINCVIVSDETLF